MYTEHSSKEFKRPSFYIILDLLYFTFFALYLIGDKDQLNNQLKYVKPFPVWTLMMQLWSLRSCHANIFPIIVAFFFSSLGDICLMSSQPPYFHLGALSFLIGHIINVLCFLGIAVDIAENKVFLREILSKKVFFVVLWIILLTFTFWSISLLTVFVGIGDSKAYIFAVYGACLSLFVMGGCFFYFTTSHISSNLKRAGQLIMTGCLVFFVSDNFVAHNKFNLDYRVLVSRSMNSYLQFISYFLAQWLVAKGVFLVSVHLSQGRKEISKSE